MKTGTATEKKNDISTAKKFHAIFLKKFSNQFPNFEVYQESKENKSLGHGAGSIFVSEINIPTMSETAQNKAGLRGDKIRGMIWIDSEVNPHGITGKHDIGRTYTIHCKFTGIGKMKKGEFINDKLFIAFYSYSRDIKYIIEEFNSWLLIKFKVFESDIANKKYHWENSYK